MNGANLNEQAGLAEQLSTLEAENATLRQRLKVAESRLATQTDQRLTQLENELRSEFEEAISARAIELMARVGQLPVMADAAQGPGIQSVHTGLNRFASIARNELNRNIRP